MAITGSGKYVRIENGTMTLGQTTDPTSGTFGYAEIFADWSALHGNKRGFTCNAGYINLTGVSNLSIGVIKGYTGVIPMLTSFSSPYPILIYDDSFDLNNIRYSFTNYRFVNGFFVGAA